MKALKEVTGLFITACIFNINMFAQSTWTAVGAGLNARGLAMTEYNGNLYIGKLNFTTPDEINKWNDTALSGVGAGTDGPVGAFVINGSDLYVGGGFTNAGGSPASDVAKWNGSAWAAIGTQMDNFCINALAIFAGDLYAAGYGFNGASAPSAYTVAKWTGSSWVGLGSGLQGGDVYCLTVYNGELYASGTFTTAGSVACNHIAKWNGTAWSAVGTGTTNGTTIYTLKEYGGALYAGGDFNTIGGVATNCIAKWNGTAWSQVGTAGTGANNTVIALSAYNGDLYAGGAFGNIGGVAANHIAKWNGTTWSTLGTGIGTVSNVNEQVWCIAPYKNSIYAAGTFTTAGGAPATNIAKWKLSTTAVPTVALPGKINIYPNPAENEATIELEIANTANVIIDVYNLLGQKVLNLCNGTLDAGMHQYHVGDKELLVSGVYMVSVTTDEGSTVSRLVMK